MVLSKGSRGMKTRFWLLQCVGLQLIDRLHAHWLTLLSAQGWSVNVGICPIRKTSCTSPVPFRAHQNSTTLVLGVVQNWVLLRWETWTVKFSQSRILCAALPSNPCTTGHQMLCLPPEVLLETLNILQTCYTTSQAGTWTMWTNGDLIQEHKFCFDNSRLTNVLQLASQPLSQLPQ